MGHVELDVTNAGLCPVAGQVLVVLNLLANKFGISEDVYVCVCVCVCVCVRTHVSVCLSVFVST
jgi:hypothetical protein